MQETFNPYTPPESIELADVTKLTFDGTITVEDYAKLCQSRTRKNLLILLLAIYLPMIAFVFVSGLYVILFEPDIYKNFLLPVGIILMFALAYYALRMLSGKHQARMMETLRPDLFTPAKGELSQNGLVFYDGSRTHWFGADILPKLIVTAAGLRVPVEVDYKIFLALAARNFHHFDLSQTRRLIASWKRANTSTKIVELTKLKNNIHFLGLEPTETAIIRFAGQAQEQSSEPQKSPTKIALLYGWLSNEELAWGFGTYAARVPLSSLAVTRKDDEGILLGTAFWLPRKHFESDAAWQEANRMIEHK